MQVPVPQQTLDGTFIPQVGIDHHMLQLLQDVVCHRPQGITHNLVTKAGLKPLEDWRVHSDISYLLDLIALLEKPGFICPVAEASSKAVLH
jgi:hypothetical protein